MSVDEARLVSDLTRAMKERDRLKTAVLRSVIADVKNVKVERRVQELSEAEITRVLRRQVRAREEAGEFATKAGRQDLVEQNAAERAVLEPYLPSLITGAGLEDIIRALIAESDAPDIGTVMRGLRTRCAGNFDGKEASETVRRLLAEGPRSA